MKHKSKYAQKLNKRRSAGKVYVTMAAARRDFVDARGQRHPMPIIPTPLNRDNVLFEHGRPRTRVFERLHRSDEV